MKIKHIPQYKYFELAFNLFGGKVEIRHSSKWHYFEVVFDYGGGVPCYRIDYSCFPVIRFYKSYLPF